MFAGSSRTTAEHFAWCFSYDLGLKASVTESKESAQRVRLSCTMFNQDEEGEDVEIGRAHV